MAFRYCVPRVQGHGAGLGNELIPWARSFLAAQILGARSLPPAFGLNTRRYWRHFGTPRYDWIAHRAMASFLPVVEFGEADYVQHGGGDVLHALRRFAKTHDLHRRHAFIFMTEGMWGGYGHIAAARDFIFSTLYSSRFAARNLLSMASRVHPDKLTVAMHVRLGDFAPPPDQTDAFRGRFNCALPIEWYCRVVQSINARLGGDVQFLVVSDGREEQLKPLLDIVPMVTTAGLSDSDCSDLLLLAKADLLVCSVSSYSSLAAFLSDAPYLWFEPNLQQHDEGFYSIWGHDTDQRRQGSPTRTAIESQISSMPDIEGRGEPVGLEGVVPERILQQVIQRRRQRNPLNDLIRYGVVPMRPHKKA